MRLGRGGTFPFPPKTFKKEGDRSMALLVMRDVHKRYGGVRALSGASFEAEAGEGHGLLGANGSGKSTLDKVSTGVVYPDHGTIDSEGVPTAIRRPTDT